jgi:hypothetical protein
MKGTQQPGRKGSVSEDGRRAEGEEKERPGLGIKAGAGSKGNTAEQPTIVRNVRVPSNAPR